MPICHRGSRATGQKEELVKEGLNGKGDLGSLGDNSARVSVKSQIDNDRRKVANKAHTMHDQKKRNLIFKNLHISRLSMRYWWQNTRKKDADEVVAQEESEKSKSEINDNVDEEKRYL